MRAVQAKIELLSGVQVPFSERAEWRLRESIVRRSRRGPVRRVSVASHLMPAATGTVAAALLLLVGLQLGISGSGFQQPPTPSASTSASISKHQQRIGELRLRMLARANSAQALGFAPGRDRQPSRLWSTKGSPNYV